jgi:hypothetical protein
MVDSGGQGSFINRNLSQTYHLPSVPKSPPVTLILADGEPSPHKITHYSPLLLKTGSNTESYALDIANTANDIILGIPWLKTHDPSVRFGSETLTFDSEYCHQSCSHYGETIPLHSVPKEAPVQISTLGEELRDEGDRSKTVLPPRNLSEISRQQVTRDGLSPDAVDEVVPSSSAPFSEALLTPQKYTKRRKSSVRFHSNTKSKVRCYTAPTPRSERPPSNPVFTKAPAVSLISAHAFSTLCNQATSQLYLMSFSPASPTVEDAIDESTLDMEPDWSSVLAEYHEFKDLFSKKEADELPPHRASDHAIDLEPGTSPPWGHLNAISPVELETLRNYVDEYLEKGFIRPSHAPCGAPILFVKKADGSLRICVDYRGLNKLTKKNRYPLPLIGEMLDRLSRAKVFTTFDVRDGYHRLRMKAGEEWKTAFRCRYGLFEYTVMPFSLCNAPGTFQYYMNDTFRDMLDKFLIVYLDDMLIYSDSLAEHKRHVRMVLERLREAKLYLSSSKEPQDCQSDDLSSSKEPQVQLDAGGTGSF